MLKYMPLYGSILLTIIIVWIVVSTFIGNRRKIGQAVAGTYVQSICCGATTTPLGWTEEGWTSRCDECGSWQYLGDDHDNPPPGFNADGTPSKSRHAPAPRPSAAIEPESLATGLRLVSDPEVTSEDGPSELPYYPVLKARAAATIAHALGDEGEPLAVPPPPNIGGEGHPDYQGPHYAVPHDRFVPYDVLHDPLPGAAVHIVGNVACVGPLEVESGDRGDATLNSVREDEDEL